MVNERAVEYGVRVALALECEIATTSIFARKNYFYPDLPKGYQISQYEQPLAHNGRITLLTSQGERTVRVRRVHLEEDTGKLTHIRNNEEVYSLVDLNRAGVPLLEIVSEPDLHSAEDVRAYAVAMRSLLRYLGVNSGDMEKGVMRIEPNVSVRPAGSMEFGTRTEIKNLNSFRALERAVDYEIQRQIERLRLGNPIVQETVGWDDLRGVTFTQRVKEGEDDYRYFPEPDLPPLELDPAWIESIRESLPELPAARFRRFQVAYGLNPYDAEILIAERGVADYFEATVAAAGEVSPKTIANWVSGELFAWLNQTGQTIESCPVTPEALADLLQMVKHGEINQNTGKNVLGEMLRSERTARDIVAERGLGQISDSTQIARLVRQVLEENPEQVSAYFKGKETISRWLFGQVMRLAKGQGAPQLIQQEMDRQLAAKKAEMQENGEQ